MFDSATLFAYIAAATALVLIPGPGTAWIVAQTLNGGSRRGAQAAIGLETATLIHALAAGLGLSAVLATSAMAFDLLKYAGAAYLIWLGIKNWREPATAPPPTSGQEPAQPVAGSARSLYLRSVITGVLNPKVALFFLAFLPQFVAPERGWVPLQFLILGVLLSFIGLAHSLALSYLVGRFGRRASHPRFARWKQRLTGSVFIALGLRLAVQQRN
ncbi:LysE family translocator [Pseudoxanthomonas wuyuanensis]|uniref:Threonine/homoserine/homoserine lactone efflux protein n=1 Tax=Pseudoxanthomonas wuyuanensis TaxID=1073196 RepID=A0A286DDA2_9GAMM|nr:LysE family translocator [Pseudoxanthomonas wuyuanensis]KAF1720708.1 LysE family translocator [Pseudoxanthomonas wuyuanensis]SOD56609.1 Threonine/homoserine/homoserine lactone efflux protein [Pseudoxanthomonas wuyuanensis]